MDIAQFVETTLVQIMNGVRAAQGSQNMPSSGGRDYTLISPRVRESADNAPKNKHFTTVDNDLVHMVDFDIAVTATLEKLGEADTGLKIAGIGLGGKIGQGSTSSEVSRIRFQVPVVFPRS